MKLDVPKIELVLPAPKMVGRFKIEAISPDGTRRLLADWFDNLILDGGLNLLGSTNVLGYCHVGTSSTAPANNQTGLLGWVASTSVVMESASGNSGAPPYYGWRTQRFRFAQGAAAGNLSEVGISPNSTNASQFWSRALIKDGLGNPTTITVLSTEVLDVTYELRNYVPTGDTTGSVVINAVTYNWTARAALAGNSVPWGNYVGSQVGYWTGNSWTAYSGVMGAYTSSPSGTSSSTNGTVANYSNNSLYRDFTGSWGLDAGNVGGIKSLLVATTIGYFQYEFDSTIPKDNTKTFAITVRIAWARYP